MPSETVYQSKPVLVEWIGETESQFAFTDWMYVAPPIDYLHMFERKLRIWILRGPASYPIDILHTSAKKRRVVSWLVLGVL